MRGTATLKLCCVALLAEGVDRNCSTFSMVISLASSPSSRRAWIEILGPCRSSSCLTVALLAEGVDRNRNMIAADEVKNRVALLAEGVDRNKHRNALCARFAVALLAEGVDRKNLRVYGI